MSGTGSTQVYPGLDPTAVAGSYFLLESTIIGRAGNTEGYNERFACARVDCTVCPKGYR